MSIKDHKQSGIAVAPAGPSASGGGRIGSVLTSGVALALLGVIAFALLAPGKQDGGSAGSVTSAGSGAAAAAQPATLRAGGSASDKLQQAPDFTLNGLAGKPVSLSDFRGHPVWINFWATWCPPCNVEMPEMAALYSKYKSRGLVILGVDLGEDQQTVAEFATARGFDWTFVLDSSAAVADQYHAIGTPAHVFVDSSGAVRGFQVGGLTATDMEMFLARIIP